MLDGTTGELHAADRAAPPHDSVRRGRTLEEAHVATFFRQDRLVLPTVEATAHSCSNAPA